MKIPNRIQQAGWVLLTAALVYAGTLGLTSHPVQAEPDIEDVIQGINKDGLLFGGKEELKRDNLQITNEVNREQVQIRENATLRNLSQGRAGSTTTTVTCDVNSGSKCTTVSYNVTGTGTVEVTIGSYFLGTFSTTSSGTFTAASGTTATASILCQNISGCSATTLSLNGATCSPAISNVVLSNGQTFTSTCTAA